MLRELKLIQPELIQAWKGILMSRNEFSLIRLPCTGRKPGSFYGELIVESHGADLFPWATHGHDISVYQVSGGGFAVLVTFWTHSQSESVNSSLHKLEKRALSWFLLNYDASLAGYTIGKRSDLSRLEKYELQLQFDEQVTDILAEMNCSNDFNSVA